MAQRIRPNMSDVLSEMGRLYFEEGDYDTAYGYLNKSLFINRTYFDALVLRGYLWIKINVINKAVSDLNRALKIHPFDNQARLFRGMVFQKSEKWDKALEDYDMAISLNPEETAYLNRAVIKMHLEQYQSALEDARGALKLSCVIERCCELIEEIEERMGGV